MSRSRIGLLTGVVTTVAALAYFASRSDTWNGRPPTPSSTPPTSTPAEAILETARGPLAQPPGPRPPTTVWRRTCATRCQSLVRIDPKTGDAACYDSPELSGGTVPQDLWHAYDIPPPDPNPPAVRPRIAIVVSGRSDTAEGDLAVYRKQFSLPPCGSGDGCLQMVNAAGGTDLPPADSNWALEIDEDLEAASAVCPWCRLLLIEADPSGAPGRTLYDAIDRAVQMNAVVVSNSWDEPDRADSEASLEHYFTDAKIPVFFGAGEGGYYDGSVNRPRPFPSWSPNVWAVGGTRLSPGPAPRGWSETVWNDPTGETRSGCNTSVSKPAWQTVDTGCVGRATNDVAATASPGLAVFDTSTFCKKWQVSGGTSLSVVVVAAMFARAGLGGVGGQGPGYAYSHPGNFFDVDSGSNDDPPGCGTALCTAGPGWDGPTGYGSPDFRKIAGLSLAGRR